MLVNRTYKYFLEFIRPLRRRIILGSIFGLCLIAFLIPRPPLLEDYSYSSAVYDRNGRLLKLSLSLDDKYRLFVPYEQLPPQAPKALLLYEDRWFEYHPGINPLSIFRAMISMASGSRRQGASTITMQLARIAYNLNTAKISGKIIQILRAIQIELFYSKKQILEAYFNLSPYGGNIEGLGAAAQVYFNKKAKDLNLQQIIALMVIPQNPAKRNLLSADGRAVNDEASKRLQELWKQNFDDVQNQYLGLPLASRKYLPSHAPHFVRQVLESNRGSVESTLNLDYQFLTEEILQNYVRQQRLQGIHNAAALIIDAGSNEIIADVGSADFYNKEISGQVDGTTALRSPGSALKPFIYSLALEQGLIHPRSRLKDVPRNYGLYTPENFDRAFYGLVDATEALVYSRNIPAVDLLLKVGENNFYNLLKSAGVSKLKSADYYGLALALGGAEMSMQNLGALYAMLYNDGFFQPLSLTKNQTKKTPQKMILPEAAFLTLDMLSQNQPVDGSNNLYAPARSMYPVSWKTGTSYGYKDAWAVGVVGRFVIVVWVGNFDGTPNQSLVGRDMAGPLFFKLVRTLAKHNIIPHRLVPNSKLRLAKVEICTPTGDLADAYCDKRRKSYFIPGVSAIKLSNISRLIPIDIKTKQRACRHRPPQTVLKSFEFWPSDVVKAYAKAGLSLRRPPDFGEDCAIVDTADKGHAPNILTPADKTTILVHSAKIQEEKIAVSASLDADASRVYWFVDNRLAGMSPAETPLEITPVPGIMSLKAVDDLGRSAMVNITVKLAD